ncbi:MAG: type II/IV secretion system protein [Ignavibacteriales bacterium]|nr:type II/IV secretion system protein [Ignavibacteriales bacterium]
MPPPSQQQAPAHPRIPLEQIDVSVLSKEKIRELFKSGRLPTVEAIVEEIFFRATKMGATDIHFEPIEGELRIRLGHEGVLKRLVSLTPDMTDNVMSVLKTRTTLNQFEKKKPQEGRYSAVYHGEPMDFRLSLIPVLAGERAVIRILRKATQIAKLEELGFSKANLDQIKILLRQPKGLLLVTGTSSSGKSTTIYAATNAVQTAEKCVITVEDPVEYRLPYASQVQLPSDRSFNFADALRAILRQNPNVILIGEIRDAETAVVASEAALTGNLVLSSMLADDALGAIHRLLNLGVQPYWLASTMVGVVYQQLMRKICPECKEPYELTPEERSIIAPYLEGSDAMFAHGKGCPACDNTGYKGRTAICEIVSVTPELRDLIFQRGSILKMREEALKSGFQGIRRDAATKVAFGLSTIHEFVRVLG